jgi:hypothetical protein
VRAGVDYLLSTQGEDGNWREALFTGTGFPKVFYLKYHLYRLYFPLMALCRYAASQEGLHHRGTEDTEKTEDKAESQNRTMQGWRRTAT